MLLKNENASIRLDFVSYEFPETEYGMDEYDKNWLQLRCTWVDEDGYTHKDSNACLLAQEAVVRAEEAVAGEIVTVARLSKAYAPPMQLIGKLYRASGGGWMADWVFVDDGRELARWSTRDGDARRAMAGSRIPSGPQGISPASSSPTAAPRAAAGR